MAVRAANPCEGLLAEQDGSLDSRIVGDHPSGDGQGRLINCRGSHISPCQLIRESITVGICVCAEAFGRLNPVMLIKRGVRKFAQRSGVARLMPRANHEVGGVLSAIRNDTRARQAFHLGSVPKSVSPTTDTAKRYAFREKRL